MKGDWLGLLAAVVAGAAVGGLAWPALRPVFSADVLTRRNFRDREVPVGGGVAIVLGMLIVFALAVVAGPAWALTPIADGRGAVLVVVFGFALLGFVDDVAGSGRDRGFRGHLRQLARGRVTPGALKVLGGGAVAVLAVDRLGTRSLADLIRDAALIALAANLANLMDLAPGRAIKAALLAFAGLLLATRGHELLRGPAVVVGAAAGLLWPDLRERLMLGDTGANPLGAVLGLAVVMVCAPSIRLVVAFLLLLLNVASEFVSFSRVIAALPPLRMLDEVGRAK